jgi:type I restriction enzyme S subunit
MIRGLEKQPCLYPDKLMRVRLDESRAKPEFVEIVFSDEIAHARLIEKAKSSAGQNGISGKDLKMQLIPLPPLPEQQEIVRRVNSLFALADNLDARHQKAKVHVDKLTQSVLAKAFRGELVPTEAELAKLEGREYEPASVLLERIQAERETRPKTARKKATRKRAAKNRS